MGILAAIAIPSFLKYQLRTKSAEGPSNVMGIRAAQLTLYSAGNRYIALDVQPRPDADLNGSKFVWRTEAEIDAAMDGWEQIGWRPDGPVHFNYSVAVDDTMAAAFVIEAHADIDDNETLQCLLFRKANPAGDNTLPYANPAACTDENPRAALDLVYKSGPDGVF